MSNRAMQARLARLESRKGQGEHFTLEGLRQAAETIRAGGTVGGMMGALFSPWQICRMADLQFEGRDLPEPRPVFIPTALEGTAEAMAQAEAWRAIHPEAVLCRVIDGRGQG